MDGEPTKTQARPMEPQTERVEHQARPMEPQTERVEHQARPMEPPLQSAELRVHSQKRQTVLEIVAGLLALPAVLGLLYGIRMLAFRRVEWREGLTEILPFLVVIPGCLLFSIVQLARNAKHGCFYACLLGMSGLGVPLTPLFWVLFLMAH